MLRVGENEDIKRDGWGFGSGFMFGLLILFYEFDGIWKYVIV